MFIFFTVENNASKDEEIENLIFRIAEGSRDAVGKLYEKIRDGVFAYALSKTKNKADAEDVLQDTFVKICRYAGGYVPQGKPMAWIYTITVNVAKRHVFLNSRHISYDERIGEDIPYEQSVEDTAIKNELVRKILSQLCDEEREIVVLHAVSGLKHREIASLLDIPLSTALSKYNRAIKKLQKSMGGTGDE